MASQAAAKRSHKSYLGASELPVQSCRPLTTQRPIDSRSPAELLELQIKLGLGATFGLIEVPREWMPAGTFQARSLRTVDFRKLLPRDVLAESEAGAAILTPLVRTALAMRFFDHLRKKLNGTRLQASTWVGYVRELFTFAAIALSKRESAEGPLFAGLKPEDLRDFATRSSARAFLNLVSSIHENGLLSDWPASPPAKPGGFPENVGNGDDALIDPEAPAPKKYQPLPDIFVAEAGRRAVWIVEELGPTLLDCFEACNSPDVLALTKQERTDARAKIIQKWQWQAPSGAFIEKLPFRVMYGIKHAAPLQWCEPARKRLFKRSKKGMVTYKQLCMLVNILQGSHLFVTSLAFGDRHSEQASIRMGSIVESKSGDEYARGKTYKLAFRQGGATQDWPISQVTVEAIAQQERLSTIVRGGSTKPGDPLWVKLSTAGGNKHHTAEDDDPTLLSINSVYDTFLTSLELERFLSSDAPRLTQHRFRKTLARLIAVALVNSAEVLMMFFGHRAIEMTWQYIQTDRELQAEIAQLAEHLMILNGVRIMKNAAGNGGPAAGPVSDFATSERARHGVRVLNQSQLIEGALTLTAGGRIGHLVRPGVLCMMQPGEVGPCTQGRGERDPASCKPSCSGRLELGEPKHRQDVEATIADVVQKWEAADLADDDLKRSWAAGQICAQVPRFPDIAQRWMKNETVARVMFESAGKGTAL